jgi:hypothetical protein
MKRRKKMETAEIQKIIEQEREIIRVKLEKEIGKLPPRMQIRLQIRLRLEVMSQVFSGEEK